MNTQRCLPILASFGSALRAIEAAAKLAVDHLQLTAATLMHSPIQIAMSVLLLNFGIPFFIFAILCPN